MLSKYRIALLGMIVSCGSSLIASQNPKIVETPQKRNLLSCSAELRKNQDLPTQRTAAIGIINKKNKNTGFMYYEYPGSSSPVDYGQVLESRDAAINLYDCP